MTRLTKRTVEALKSNRERDTFLWDSELRGFGDNGIDFAVEFWVEGLDDGPNKYTSDVLFLVWNALRDAGIEIPYPQRVVEIKGGVPQGLI